MCLLIEWILTWGCTPNPEYFSRHQTLTAHYSKSIFIQSCVVVPFSGWAAAGGGGVNRGSLISFGIFMPIY